MSKTIRDLGPYPGFYTTTSMIQLGYGIWANLSTVAIGLAFGFPAIQIPQLNSPASTFMVSTEEVSWIASILSLFSPIGCLLSGVVMDRFGRSVMIRYCTVPMFVGWMYTVTSDTALHMIMARAVLGVGCGMAMGPSRLYTAEISLPNMRGLLGALPNMFLSLGMTVQAAFGSFYPWTHLCYISAAFNVALFSSYMFLIETPYYLLLRDNTGKARKALTVFRAKDYDIEKEINDLIDYKQENNIRSLNCREKLKAMTTSNACKPFGIIMIFITFECLAGTPIVTFWTIELLLALKSSSDVYEGNFYIAFTRLLFCAIASALLFRTPRKTMALISAGGVGVTCLTLAVFLYLEKKPSIYPQIFLMIYTAFASLGFYILPFLFMSELYPLQIRGTLTGISISIINVEKFLTAKCFPTLRDNFGLKNSMILFGLSAFICFIFLYIFLPETKDLTLREIEEFFNDQHSTPATERQLSSLHTSSSHNKRSEGKSHLSALVQNFEHKKKNREFIEIYERSNTPSMISRDSKKSVTLLIGGKQFKTMSSAEQAEMEHVQANTDQADSILPISSYFFNKTEEDENAENESVSSTDRPSTSKNAERSNEDNDKDKNN